MICRNANHLPDTSELHTRPVSYYPLPAHHRVCTSTLSTAHEASQPALPAAGRSVLPKLMLTEL